MYAFHNFIFGIILNYKIIPIYQVSKQLLLIAFRDVVLMFRLMNTSGTGTLSTEEFLSVYDVAVLCWEPQYSSIPWYHAAWKPLQFLCKGANIAISWPYFESVICK